MFVSLAQTSVRVSQSRIALLTAVGFSMWQKWLASVAGGGVAVTRRPSVGGGLQEWIGEVSVGFEPGAELGHVVWVCGEDEGAEALGHHGQVGVDDI